MTDLNEIIDFYIKDTESAARRHEFMMSFKYSGYALLDKIGQDESIIDIGCGKNLFKNHFPNLLGIDPATDEADIRVSLQHFHTDRTFDVALCLGSIQGSDLEVRQQITKIRQLLSQRGRIYWRCMPDPPPHQVPEWMSLWTFEKHRSMAQELGFTIAQLRWDLNPSGNRIYAEWVKNHT